MDAWLLADVNAISTAVQRKGGKPVTKSHDNPEGLLDPKEWLRKLLTDHKVGYTADVCGEIAQKPICKCFQNALAFASLRN